MENLIKMAIDLENHAAQLRKMAGQRVQTLADKLEEMGVDVKVYAATLLFTRPDMTQQDVADHLGISRRTLLYWKKEGFSLKDHLAHMSSHLEEKEKYYPDF